MYEVSIKTRETQYYLVELPGRKSSIWESKQPTPTANPVEKVGAFAPYNFQRALREEGAVYTPKIHDFRPKLYYIT